jgi:hypothetical protein
MKIATGTTSEIAKPSLQVSSLAKPLLSGAADEPSADSWATVTILSSPSRDRKAAVCYGT